MKKSTLRIITDQPLSTQPLSLQPQWKLDQETREIGRRGLAMARQALKEHCQQGENPVAA